MIDRQRLRTRGRPPPRDGTSGRHEGGWKLYTTDKGDQYYHNSGSGESVWATAYIEAAAATSSAAQARLAPSYSPWAPQGQHQEEEEDQSTSLSPSGTSTLSDAASWIGMASDSEVKSSSGGSSEGESGSSDESDSESDSSLERGFEEYLLSAQGQALLREEVRALENDVAKRKGLLSERALWHGLDKHSSSMEDGRLVSDTSESELDLDELELFMEEGGEYDDLLGRDRLIDIVDGILLRVGRVALPAWLLKLP
ncbi:unnamed protein product, partial [Chrysoparadoxa australica]